MVVAEVVVKGVLGVRRIKVTTVPARHLVCPTPVLNSALTMVCGTPHHARRAARPSNGPSPQQGPGWGGRVAQVAHGAEP